MTFFIKNMLSILPMKLLETTRLEKKGGRLKMSIF